MAADSSVNSGASSPLARRRRRPRERGQAVIEFALFVPILLTLLLGLVELGNGINDYIKIISTARDAARLGAQTCTYSNINTGNGSDCATSLKALVTKETESLRTDIPTACTPGSAGMCIYKIPLTGTGFDTKSVKVSVCYDHPLIIGLAGIIPNPLRMCSSSEMRVIQP